MRCCCRQDALQYAQASNEAQSAQAAGLIDMVLTRGNLEEHQLHLEQGHHRGTAS